MAPYSILSPHGKDLVRKAIPKQTSRIITVAVARLYVAYPDPTQWTWTGLSGAVALISDQLTDSYYFKMVDVCTKEEAGIIWDQEIYQGFVYNQDRSFFHSFEIDNCLAGFLFADQKEASTFFDKVVKHVQKLNTQKSGFFLFGSRKKTPLHSENANTNAFTVNPIPQVAPPIQQQQHVEAQPTSRFRANNTISQSSRRDRLSRSFDEDNDDPTPARRPELAQSNGAPSVPPPPPPVQTSSDHRDEGKERKSVSLSSSIDRKPRFLPPRKQNAATYDRSDNEEPELPKRSPSSGPPAATAVRDHLQSSRKVPPPPPARRSQAASRQPPAVPYRARSDKGAPPPPPPLRAAASHTNQSQYPSKNIASARPTPSRPSAAAPESSPLPASRAPARPVVDATLNQRQHEPASGISRQPPMPPPHPPNAASAVLSQDANAEGHPIPDGGGRPNLMASIRASGGLGSLKKGSPTRTGLTSSSHDTRSADAATAGGNDLASSLAQALNKRKNKVAINDNGSNKDEEW